MAKLDKYCPNCFGEFRNRDLNFKYSWAEFQCDCGWQGYIKNALERHQLPAKMLRKEKLEKIRTDV